jgi:hypothetical protein
MANTNDLKRPVESYVRGWLEEQFGVHFEDSEIPLRLTSGGLHRFDAVSKDRSVVAGVKTSQMRPGGDVGVGTVKSAYAELYFLSLVKAKRRLLVLTDEGFCRYFSRKSEGKVARGIEIQHCPLPASLAKRVREVWTSASEEIGKRSR